MLETGLAASCPGTSQTSAHLRNRFRYDALSAITLLLLAIPATQSQAEPMLKLHLQPVANRAIPEPISVEDYRGTLQWGYERLSFIAPGGEIRWDAWTDPSYIGIAQTAMRLVEQTAVGNRACNDFFARMPGGKTFAELWQATGPERIQISFSPGPSGTWRAATYAFTAPYEWTITEITVKLGPASVASAMVHEATRSNGVGADVKTAYGAERACGMRQYVLDKPLLQQLGWKPRRLD